MNLGEKIFETIRNKNYSVKPEHLVRQAFCEWHKTRKKQWVIDLDKDEMVETWVEVNFGGKAVCKREWTLEKVQELVKKHLKLVGKSEDDMYTVPTKNGWHVITSPFNLAEAYKECSLLFEGRKRLVVGLDAARKSVEKETTGWLHKDGMTLLYCAV